MFDLPRLPYGYAGLEPILDARTLMVHHNQLHRGYVQRLNQLVRANHALQGKTLVELLEGAKKGSDLAHVAGAHFNHSLLWRLMTRVSESGDPRVGMLELILTNFGSVHEFRSVFSETALSLNGPGWVWAALDERGELVVAALVDQETLIPFGLHPLFCIDVWEHAYMFKYNANKALYITRFWELINWDAVEQLVQLFFAERSIP